MIRMLIGLEESDRRWLEQRSKELSVPISGVVRQAIRAAQEREQKSVKELLESTKGLWRRGDGLKYQRRVRAEWR